MSIFTIIGLFLLAGTILIDRYLRKLPNWLAIILYIIAVLLFLAGFVVSGRS